MRKLLALLVFVPSICLADPSVPKDGRYAVSGEIIVDTRTGKAWQAETVQGSGAMKFLIPLSYILPGEKLPDPNDKSFANSLSNGSIKITAEPPR